MAEEWRVSLTFARRQRLRDKASYSPVIRDLLREGLPGDVAVSADDAHVFIYTGTMDAAVRAECMAQELVAQPGVSAYSRLEWWDPAAQMWRDARAGPPELVSAGVSASARKDLRPKRRRAAAVKLIGNLVERLIESIVLP